MTPLYPGDRLDNYRIDELAAQSGMASIFRATDLRTGKLVALKIPHPQAESDLVFFERFRREQEICTALDHPNVVRALPSNGASRVYMAMEWAEGRLLRVILGEGRISLDHALKIARGICEALEHIHEHRVVHRDLKPENIMVDGEDRIKLIDFGIAGLAGAKRFTFGKLSNIMGTPDYISPEQVRGKRGDARSDIYALGVMLYEMATGQPPFQGANPFAIMNDRLLNHPVPPRQINPEISLQLQEVIYRALERDPAKRYATARELIRDLDHLNEVEPADRVELLDWKKRRSPSRRGILFYVAMASIPVVMFMLLLYVARR
jgi:serine/threonine protein kinase